MKLLQVCNVGRIVGGTAACAWTVTRALPAFEHHVAFLSPPDAETVFAFAPTPVSSYSVIADIDLAKLRPDAVLLHNTPRSRWRAASLAPTVQYLHSEIADPMGADATLCCSQWLAQRIGLPADRVLWQAVGKVPRGGGFRPPRAGARCRRHELRVGRICTPTARKWPRAMLPFYRNLASRCHDVRWEFVGCPANLQAALQSACGHRAAFHPAGWRQRARVAEWDVLLYSNPVLTESFGRIAAEAMRAGCVPVVDRLGGFAEQIPPDCGFLCEGVEQFAAALEQLADSEFRRRMSQRAARHADENFSLAHFARKLLHWFDVVLGSQKR
jgi:hypothetical protein